jgi:cysteine dioxygenase
MAIVTSLAELIASLRNIEPTQYRPDNIGRMLAELRLEPREWSPYVLFEKGRYTRNLLYRNSDFEVLLLCWDTGASSPVHDHAGQQCWFTTLEGAFDIDEYRRISGGLQEGYARILQTGTTTSVRSGEPDYRYQGNDIHRVSIAGDQTRALSLHVYARPIAECLIYDCEGDRCMRRELRYDKISQETIVLSSAKVKFMR